jgi:glycerol-3-phosphate dehydrogenase
MTPSNLSVDLLVVGGGITGAGIAQDATARGIKTILVEKGDFGSGTSSKSSKLIHGGLRYLEHFSLGLMRESIRERHTLTQLAPGLVRWAPFILPHFSGKGPKWKYSLGLWLYDHLAKTAEDLRSAHLDVSQTLAHSPDLRTDGLLGGELFHDCVTDDARLVLALILDAQERGARVYNYTMVQDFIHEKGRVVGACVLDTLSRDAWEIRARQVVNATGPWTDQVLGVAYGNTRNGRIRPAKGVHVILPRGRLDLHHTHLIPSAHDRRFLFVIPWFEGILVGTTDTEFQGDPDAVRPEREDVEYILDALQWAFPGAGLSSSDLISTYAGIRPLINIPGKSTSDVPREYKFFESGGGIITVAGGKLTTYRLMAKKVVDRVARILMSHGYTSEVLPSWTHRIRLGNPPDAGFDPFGQLDLAEDIQEHLILNYGSWARQIISILEIYPDWNRRIVPGLPCILAEAYFAVTHEKARTLEDILCRRTRVALLDPDRGRSSLNAVCEVVAGELKWDLAETQRQIEAYEKRLVTQFPAPSVIR